jgi:hypothetical protein
VKRQFRPVATLEEVNSELSIFGAYLGEGLFDNNDAHGKRIHVSKEKEEIFNLTNGYFVRSKVWPAYRKNFKINIIFSIQLSTSDQSGISAGYGFLDSLLLFPEKEFH